MSRTAVVGALLLAFSAGAAERGVTSLAAWSNGPVRFLLPGEDARAFRALETEGARALFIERFWLGRDPTPGTLRNEYREEFWARVEDANLRFSTAGPGWKSDRGRILILLGWPDRIESEDFPQVDALPRLTGTFSDTQESSRVEVDAGLDRGHRGVERWFYRNTEQASLGPNLLVVFARDLSDEYRIASDASLYSARFPSGGDSGFRSPIQLPALRDARGAINTGSLGSVDLPTISSLSGLVRFELIDAVEVPDPRRLATDVVTSSDFLALFPLHTRWLYFLAPGDGRTIVLSGLEVPGTALYGPEPPESLVSYLLCYLSFLPPGGAEGDEILIDNENAPRRIRFPEALGPMEAWVGGLVEPGEYRVALGRLDAATGRVASLRQELRVPDLSGPGPVLSSLLLAERFPDGVSLRPPVRPARPYRPEETFLLYYELYGLAAQYDVEYRFELADENGWRALGHPVRPGGRTPGRQGWEFPLSAFPTGRYRLTVIARVPEGGEDRQTVIFDVEGGTGQ
jgi:GWxTD domain-containing protein